MNSRGRFTSRCHACGRKVRMTDGFCGECIKAIRKNIRKADK